MIFLDAGHCADKTSPKHDPGAVANGNTEASIAKDYRDTIKTMLEAKGAKVVVDDDRDNLSQTIADFSVSRAGDIVLSIHLNAATPSATGVESFHQANNPHPLELAMCRKLVAKLSEIYGIKNRGAKPETESQHKRLGILKPNGFNCLIELGFITNTNDLNQILTKKQEACQAITDILWEFELTTKPDGSPNT